LGSYINLVNVSATFIKLMQIELYSRKQLLIFVGSSILTQFKKYIAKLLLKFVDVHTTAKETCQQAHNFPSIHNPPHYYSTEVLTTFCYFTISNTLSQK